MAFNRKFRTLECVRSFAGKVFSMMRDATESERAKKSPTPKCKLKKTPQFYGWILGQAETQCNFISEQACADEYSTSSTSPGHAQKIRTERHLNDHLKENLSRRAPRKKFNKTEIMSLENSMVHFLPVRRAMTSPDHLLRRGASLGTIKSVN